MPAGRQPERFGTVRDDVPEGVVRQLVFSILEKETGQGRAMIDEILAGIFGEVLLGIEVSRNARSCLTVAFLEAHDRFAA